MFGQKHKCFYVIRALAVSKLCRWPPLQCIAEFCDFEHKTISSLTRSERGRFLTCVLCRFLILVVCVVNTLTDTCDECVNITKWDNGFKCNVYTAENVLITI